MGGDGAVNQKEERVVSRRQTVTIKCLWDKANSIGI